MGKVVLNMEKFIYDESNGLWYELQGDYYIPCITLPQENLPIGVWGQLHLRYIRDHRKLFYTSLLVGGTLNSYLEQIDASAGEMFDRLVHQMTAQQGITEQLKAQNQIEWVHRMNAIRNSAREIVNAEVIFV